MADNNNAVLRGKGQTPDTDHGISKWVQDLTKKVKDVKAQATAPITPDTAPNNIWARSRKERFAKNPDAM
jgi:hypothetical protein